MAYGLQSTMSKIINSHLFYFSYFSNYFFISSCFYASKDIILHIMSFSFVSHSTLSLTLYKGLYSKIGLEEERLLFVKDDIHRYKKKKKKNKQTNKRKGKIKNKTFEN